MRLKAKERIMKEKEAESDLKEKQKKKKYLQTLQKEGIVRQSSECKTNNELGKFRDLVAYLSQNGDIYNESDYRIVYVNEFSGNPRLSKCSSKSKNIFCYSARAAFSGST